MGKKRGSCCRTDCEQVWSVWMKAGVGYRSGSKFTRSGKFCSQHARIVLHIYKKHLEDEVDRVIASHEHEDSQ